MLSPPAGFSGHCVKMAPQLSHPLHSLLRHTVSPPENKACQAYRSPSHTCSLIRLWSLSAECHQRPFSWPRTLLTCPCFPPSPCIHEWGRGEETRMLTMMDIQPGQEGDASSRKLGALEPLGVERALNTAMT